MLLVFIVLAYISIVAYGSSQIQANYFVNSINKGNTNGIALTFDDGPNAEITPRILDVLSKENIQATFFVIGKNAEQHPELVKRSMGIVTFSVVQQNLIEDLYIYLYI